MIPTNQESHIEVSVQDTQFIVINQSGPQEGRIVIRISELRGLVGLLELAAQSVSQPPPSLLTHPPRI